MEKQTKYYVIERSNNGSNRKSDEDTIGVYLSPCHYNSGTKSECIDGWAGETDGWSIWGWGAYDSIEDAEAYIKSRYDAVRKVDYCEYDMNGADCVALYKPGKYAILDMEETKSYLYFAGKDLTGRETIEELEKILAEWESEANVDGCTLHHLALDFLIDARDDALLALEWYE